MRAGEGGACRIPAPGTIDVLAVRRHFLFPGRGRIALNNAASTQPPRELLALYQALGPDYENVHRGQSSASAAMTTRFEESFDTIARFVGAPGRASIAQYRNATEAINAVMYSLLTEFRDGDNVVTTLMEHNSNYVPWYALCREILPRFGRRVQCRLARFDPVSGPRIRRGCLSHVTPAAWLRHPRRMIWYGRCQSDWSPLNPRRGVLRLRQS